MSVLSPAVTPPVSAVQSPSMYAAGTELLGRGSTATNSTVPQQNGHSESTASSTPLVTALIRLLSTRHQRGTTPRRYLCGRCLLRHPVSSNADPFSTTPSHRTKLGPLACASKPKRPERQAGTPNHAPVALTGFFFAPDGAPILWGFPLRLAPAAARPALRGVSDPAAQPGAAGRSPTWAWLKSSVRRSGGSALSPDSAQGPSDAGSSSARAPLVSRPPLWCQISRVGHGASSARVRQ
ncbi:hypothetical protein NDU88_003970 [Pleurodeles waltl]|uniref:Uncharacterized protein n=1 Tax=Pleurodeles waltl TaxID=8319 RepID=A0AAV7MCN5_PLEWA|nr:hypothetical protein NDU88_003970 [Pleurodeles waltl]